MIIIIIFFNEPFWVEIMVFTVWGKRRRNGGIKKGTVTFGLMKVIKRLQRGNAKN